MFIQTISFNTSVLNLKLKYIIFIIKLPNFVTTIITKTHDLTIFVLIVIKINCAFRFLSFYFFCHLIIYADGNEFLYSRAPNYSFYFEYSFELR